MSSQRAHYSISSPGLISAAQGQGTVCAHSKPASVLIDVTVDVNTSLASGGEWGSLSGPEIGEIDRAWKKRIVQESDDDAAAGGL